MAALACFCTAMPHAAAAQEQGSDAAEASALVIRPLSIVKVQDLDFGDIIPGVTNGTVVINPNTDAATTTGGIVSVTGTPHAAQFYTYGGPRQFLYIRRGAYPVLTNGNGDTMAVDQMRLNGPVFRYLNAEGLLDLRVGARLYVGADQPPGDYAGTFTITVTYF